MRFKRAMAASMTAVMAVSSAVVCQVTASAAAEKEMLTGSQRLNKYTEGSNAHEYTMTTPLDGTELNTYENISITFKFSEDDITELSANKWEAQHLFSLYINGDSNKKLTADQAIGINAYGEMPVANQEYTVSYKTSEALAKLTEDGVDYSTATSLSIQSGWIGSTVTRVAFTGAKDTAVYESVGYSYTSVSGEGKNVYKFEGTWNKANISGQNASLTINATSKGFGFHIEALDGTAIVENVWVNAGDTYTKLLSEINIPEDGFEINTWGDFSDFTGISIKNEKGKTVFTPKGNVAVSDVKIAAPAKTTYNVGDEVTLTASVNDDATVKDKDIVWSSDNTDVATVDETTGKVTFVGAGNVTVTAAYKSDKTIKDTVALKAEKKKVTATITAGDVTGATKEDAADKAKAAVKVVSDDLTDKDYTVSVKADGRKYMATVVLTDEASKKYELTGTNTASGTIAYKVTGLKLSTNKLAIPVTSTAGVKITATIEPEDLADGEIEWKTADNTVATVEDGLVKPVSGSAGGKTTITATVKGTTYSADCEVSIAEVINPATAIKLDKSELSGTAGDKAELKADVTAKDDTKECTDVVIWESSDEKVATVNAGSVTFVGEGTATITATAGGQSATCKVTVKAKVIAVEKVTLDKTSAELTVGDTATLKATVTPDDATDKTVTWTSSDESVATVKDGVVTAVKAGTATITAKADGKTAECRITVKAKSQPVKETVLWSGNTDLGTDWNKNVTVPKANVKIGDVIRIKVGTGSAEYHQIKIMDSSWNVLSSLKSKADAQYGTITVDKDGYVEFKVNAADAKLISEGGLILSGYDLTVSSVSNKAMKDETYAPSTKVHTVVNNGTSQIAVFAISEEDADKYQSYSVIITRGSDGKSVYEIVDDCYKYVSYNNGTEDIRISGNGAYYIMLDITGIEDSFGGITVRIVPSVPKG